MIDIAKASLVGIAIGAFGAWQYHRGFERGVEMTTCVVGYMLGHGAEHPPAEALNAACARAA